ncbi:hypothetical protein SMSP2_01975 [Limihaloglobus sulfuriphilus]|uniref:YD repeat (Two copies) n=1 Tax=Limihaloglobus sulfuriphilus TaxID=1851148 RepID=A0A1Q2MG22_9BACT|nr:hypothetical protein [Limihaloglobus sulfuriphilus]AQQ71599.1 hypothetical protein SMSP2_01975 [Limihaloglobus sulfuriphilus]
MTEDIQDYTYTYDYESRLVRIEDSQSAAVAQFCYDALGRRIMKDDNTVDYPWMYYYDNKGRMTISRSTVSVDIDRAKIPLRCKCPAGKTKIGFICIIL